MTPFQSDTFKVDMSSWLHPEPAPEDDGYMYSYYEVGTFLKVPFTVMQVDVFDDWTNMTPVQSFESAWKAQDYATAQAKDANTTKH